MTTLTSSPILLAAFVFAGSAVPQSFEWIKPSLTSLPSSRCCGAVTYDSDTHSTVLFGGGIAADVAAGDTWLFTRTLGWTQLFPATSPPPSSGPGFAYDPITKTAVLFGGNPGNFVYTNDTWTWDGVTWTQQFPAVSPPARAFNTQPMVYDGATGTVVLFGGFSDGGAGRLGDTWIWNGEAKTWTERFPGTSPSPRGTTLAYDRVTKQVVIFGGDDGAGDLADTWTWDGLNWTQHFPATSPPARANEGLAFDATIAQTVLFGGNSSDGSLLNDTWAWNGISWNQIQTPFTPNPRTGVAMNYDPNFRGLVLFGGTLDGGAFTNQTWIFR